MQKDGCRVQDTIEVSTLTQSDRENCASCCHRFLVPIGKIVDKINVHNNKVRRDHQQLMLTWSGLSTMRRGSKPKAGASLTQQLGCMCCRVHCLNCVDGCDCIQCKTACENSVQSNRDDHPYFDKNFQCSCPACKCPCSVL